MADLVKSTLELIESVEDRAESDLSDILMSAMDELATSLKMNGRFTSLPVSSTKTMIDKMIDIWAMSVDGEAEILQGEFKNVFMPLESKQDRAVELQRIIDNYFAQFGSTRVLNVIQHTENQARNFINKGMMSGRSQEETLKLFIDSIPQVASNRAKVITGTEAHTITQFASQILAERSETVLAKIWNTAADGKVRGFPASSAASAFNHRAMNKIKAVLKQKFLIPRGNGGIEALLFPGDPSGSAGNVINCRCVQTFERTG